MLPEIGESGQCKLSDAKVLVIGLGGLGCPVCLYLAGAGVGHMGLCDPDTVSLSNLQRQTLYGEDLVGKPKVEAAYTRLSKLSSSTVFELFPCGINKDNASEIISAYDLVIDCCDNHATRFLINDVCTHHGKPWIHGSIGAFHGCVATFLPGHAGYEDLYADRDELEATPPSSGGVVGAVPGIVGALEAAEAIKYICGFGDLLTDRLLIMNIKTMTFNIIEL